MDERTKADLKERLTDYVNQITDRSKSGLYNCPLPLCGSGRGRSKTGAFSIDKADPTRWKCFSCGRGGDIFDLIGEVEGITDTAGQFKRAQEIFNISSAEYQKPTKTERPKEPEEPEQIIDFTAFYLKANKDIDKTNYWRGLSRETLDRFKVGYIEKWKHPKAPAGTESPRLIIPISKYSYLARDTRDIIPEEQQQYKKSKVKGTARPIWTFNYKALASADRPIFITEGEINALSIIEVGGEAVATGSTAYTGQFIERYKEAKTTQPLILAFDNDQAGRNAEEKLAQELKSIGATYYRRAIYGNEKDANDLLIKDREELKRVVKEVEAEVKAREEKEAEQEKEAYYNAYSAEAYLEKGFLEVIDASVNTPVTPTGFNILDGILDGGLYEGLYIIGAISSLGKTTFALQIADQIAQQGRDALIISLEMAKSELIAKSISRLTLTGAIAKGISTGDAKTARGITRADRWKDYTDRENRLIAEAMDSYNSYAKHIFIIEGIGDIDARGIREAVEEHRKQRGVTPIVIVDYLQILAPQDVRDTDKRATDKNIVELKRISRDYKTPVIGISSVNRQNYKEAISFEALKESGGIEYGSDIVIGLQLKGAGSKDFDSNEAKRKDPREIEAVILKNRNGKTGDTIDFLYYPMFNYFVERQTEKTAKRKIY